MHAAVASELATFRPDVLHVTLARLAPYVRGLPAGVHVHIDFVDALSLNMLDAGAGLAVPGRGCLRSGGAADGAI